MKITKRQLRRIIKEEKAKLLKESALDDPGGVALDPNEIVADVEKLLSLASRVDQHANAALDSSRQSIMATNIELAFEANGDVKYFLQQLLSKLKGL